MHAHEDEVRRLQRLLRLRVWLGAVIAVPLAVGTALALVFFLTLSEPVPAEAYTSETVATPLACGPKMSRAAQDDAARLCYY